METNASTALLDKPLNGELTLIELKIKNPKKLFETMDYDKYCELKDNSGKTSSGKLKDFDSGVFAKSLVLWIGKMSKGGENKGYSFTMDAIEIKNGDAGILDGLIFTGNGKGILAWTKGNLPAAEVQDYNIYVTLTNPDGESKQICIDPKLRGNPGFYQFVLNSIYQSSISQELKDRLIKSLKDYCEENDIPLLHIK